MIFVTNNCLAFPPASSLVAFRNEWQNLREFRSLLSTNVWCLSPSHTTALISLAKLNQYHLTQSQLKRLWGLHKIMDIKRMVIKILTYYLYYVSSLYISSLFTLFSFLHHAKMITKRGQIKETNTYIPPLLEKCDKTKLFRTFNFLLYKKERKKDCLLISDLNLSIKGVDWKIIYLKYDTISTPGAREGI